MKPAFTPQSGLIAAIFTPMVDRLAEQEVVALYVLGSTVDGLSFASASQHQAPESERRNIGFFDWIEPIREDVWA